MTLSPNIWHNSSERIPECPTSPSTRTNPNHLRPRSRTTIHLRSIQILPASSRERPLMPDSTPINEASDFMKNGGIVAGVLLALGGLVRAITGLKRMRMQPVVQPLKISPSAEDELTAMIRGIENEVFREEIISLFNAHRELINSRLASFQKETRRDFQELKAAILDLRKDLP